MKFRFHGEFVLGRAVFPILTLDPLPIVVNGCQLPL